MAHVGGGTRPGDDDFAHIDGARQRRGVASCIGPAGNGQKPHQKEGKFCFSVHICEVCGYVAQDTARRV